VLSLSDIVNVKVGIGRGVFEAPGATVIGGKKPSFNLEILKLFANGEQGFWYDPSDMGMMFQDAAGTVPVTAVGQAVGLIRDKSGRNNHARQTTSAARPIFRQKPILGSELLVNGDFSNGTTGWTANNATLNNVNGELEIVSTGTGPRAQQPITLVVGKRYLLRFKLRRGTAPNASQVRFGTSAGVSDILSTSSLSDVYREIEFTANSSSAVLTIGYGETATGQTSYWDNISIRELLGYLTDQNYIEYDGVDDKLITTLPAQLTGCTVIRSVPNVGTQILTNQTIPATYEGKTDHCGLIVINRALTPSETSAITTEFNKRAGV